MSITLGTLALISAGLGVAGSAGGALGSAINNKKARKEENAWYNRAQNTLNSRYYQDPLSTVGGRSLLKLRAEQRADNLDAIRNRAVAGGATVENELAALKAENEVDSRLGAQLLMGDDQRRQAIDAQKFALDQQHSANLQNGFYQNAQNWQAWGAAMGNAGMDLGSALLGGANAGKTLKDIIG